MVTSLLEEKENRVTEMILTTLDPTTLVVGKVISLFDRRVGADAGVRAAGGHRVLFFRDRR